MQVLELATVSRRPFRSAVLDSSDPSPLRNGAYSISQACRYITPDISLSCGSLAGGGIVFAGPFYPLVDFELLMRDNWQACTQHFLMRDVKTNIDSLYGNQNVANTRMNTMTIYYVQGNTTRFPATFAGFGQRACHHVALGKSLQDLFARQADPASYYSHYRHPRGDARNRPQVGCA
ncbi:hypothetical protein BD309DRAFT_1083517 [Dichomitus squalens]|nr:hypothetical protein BD309DRAFT_1083517 [Dichomitus squalens]